MVDPTKLKPGDRIRHSDGDEWIVAERKTGAMAEPFPGWWLSKPNKEYQFGLADVAWESGEWSVVEPDDEGPETAMVLSQLEWRLLAEICESYLNQAPGEVVALSAPEHGKLARRIIEATR